MNKKNIVTLLLVITLFALLFIRKEVIAANVVDSKTEGTITWTLYTDGTLNIVGSGEITSNLSYNNFKSNVKEIVIGNGISMIGSSAFSDFQNLEHITIPSSVTIIKEYSFHDCKSLKNLVIPNSVTDIFYDAFLGCKALETVSLSNSLTSLGHGIFLSCSSLNNITIPTSIKSIEQRAFERCINLDNISIPQNVTSIGDRAFYDCQKLNTVSISESLLSKINIDEVFYGTAWLLSKKAPIKGSIGSNFYEIDKDMNLIIYGNSKFERIIEGDLYSFQNLIKTVTFSGNITDISLRDNTDYYCFDNIFINLMKITNNTSQSIPLCSALNHESYHAFSWCDVSDKTEPVYYIKPNSSVVKVSPKLKKHYKIIFDGNGATSGTMNPTEYEVDKQVTIPKECL
ncbi:leucine-rich repeat domain-containing protein [Butyrivibrio sp. WCE2006]|uniref:leucine-rich repeat domain-containing protein n=1 Tax=Butyrivibrio sp. WCE2006 TaxID=1410611 RepID=UPI000678AF4D|nr:leucine-rich repeat domain-containing protein [Butyrivibrio sp. WCE2006]